MNRLLLVLLLVLLAPPAYARPVLEMQAKPAFGNQAAYGQPIPISVTVTNRGDSARLRIEAHPDDAGGGWQGLRDQVGEAIVDLPSGSRKRVDLLIPRLYGTSTVAVTAWEGRTMVAERFLTMDVQYQQPRHVGVLSPESTGFAYLASYKWAGGRPEDIAVSRLDPELFPKEAASLASLDVLVLHDLPRVGLTAASQKAIAEWVRNGGRLLLVSSLDPREFRGSPLESLLPLRPDGTANVEGLPMLTGPLDRAKAPLKRGSETLLAIGPRVAGTVALLTMPLPSTDILGSAQTEAVWKAFVHACNGHAARFPALGEQQLLLSPPELKPPDLALVAWFLLAYVVLVGPVNWMILRRQDRMLRIFLTVPLLSGVFGLLAFTGGWLVRGDEVLLLESGQLGLRAGEAGGRWQGSTGLYSPRPDEYALSFPLDTEIVEDQAPSAGHWPMMAYVLDDRLEIQRLQMRMWSMRRFRSSRPVLLAGAVELQPDGGAWRVTNRSELDLKHCTVTRGGRFSEAFDLGPGQTRTVALGDQELVAPPGSTRFDSEYEVLLGRARVELAAAPQHPHVLGWTQRPMGGSECSDPTATRSSLTMVLVQGDAPR